MSNFVIMKEGMKKILLFIIILILLGGIPLMVFYVGQRQELRKKAAPATTLSLTPASLTKKIDDTFSLEVSLDSGENQIVAAELHLTYDPTKIEVQSITNGPLFPNILASGTIENGAVSIAVGAADAKQPVTGTGTVAVIKIKALAATDAPTSIKFSPNTFVGGLGEGASNVLVGSTPATITIAGQQAQTALTPTPTPSPTPASEITPHGSTSDTPILTPTIAPTVATPPVSQASGSGTLVILSPTQENSSVKETAVIHGKASPGATITLTIYSTPQTVTITADSNGNWTYTPTTPLESGPHNIVASVTDQTGVTETATSAFVVASSGQKAQGATESAIPVSGNIEMTLVLLFIGGLFLGFGIIRPSFLSQP